MNIRVSLGLVCWAVASAPLIADDTRTWTSREHSSLKAKFLSLEDGMVSLANAEGKVLKLKVGDLSLADRHHLVKTAEADPKILTTPKLGVPEKEVRIATKEFVRRDDKLSLFMDSEGDFDLLETTHFLIATHGRVRPQALAEMAERLWHGMAFQHLDFRDDWGDRRMLILATSDEEFYQAIGKWYAKSLDERGLGDQANRISSVWDRVASVGLNLPSGLREKYHLHPTSKLFHAKQLSSYRKVFGPFPTHGIAGALLGHQLGKMTKGGSTGYYAITTGHAYYKEILLAEKTETSQINPADYEGDEVASTRGFEDGTSWAKTLRKMVRKEDVKLDLAAMLQWTGQDLDPTRLVTIYAFGYYLQSTPERLAAYAKLVQRITGDRKVPPVEEMAEIYGFDSVEAMEADWIEFVKSKDFE